MCKYSRYSILICLTTAFLVLTDDGYSKLTEIQQKIVSGKIEYQKKNYYKAKEIFNQVIKINPFHARAYNYLGKIHSIKGDKDAAEKLFIKAVTLSPGNEKYILDLSIHYLEEESYDSALASISKSLSINEENEEAWLIKAKILFKSGNRKNALQILKNLHRKKIFPDVPVILGKIAEDAGDSMGAISYYQTAIHQDSTFIPAEISLANIQKKNDNISDAFNMYEKILHQKPDYLPALIRYMDIGVNNFPGLVQKNFIQKDNPNWKIKFLSLYTEGILSDISLDTRIHSLKRILDNYPEDFIVLYTIKTLLMKLKANHKGRKKMSGEWIRLGLKTAEAMKNISARYLFSVAAELNPQNPDAHREKAIILHEQKRDNQSEAELKKVLELNPADQVAQDLLESIRYKKSLFFEDWKLSEKEVIPENSSPLFLISNFKTRSVYYHPDIGDKLPELISSILGERRLIEPVYKRFSETYTISDRIKEGIRMDASYLVAGGIDESRNKLSADICIISLKDQSSVRNITVSAAPNNNFELFDEIIKIIESVPEQTGKIFKKTRYLVYATAYNPLDVNKSDTFQVLDEKFYAPFPEWQFALPHKNPVADLNAVASAENFIVLKPASQGDISRIFKDMPIIHKQ